MRRMREAERTITWETGLPNVDVRLVHAAVTGATIDGYAVTNPVNFQGRHVRISIFNAFAPLIHLGALQTVASMLDLELVAIVAEPYAVARCMDDQQVQQAGALFIDVGGGTTDVALVRQGGIEGTRMFALGGRAFTKSLADRLELPFGRAEEIKVDFAKGVESNAATRSPRSWPRTSRCGRPASSWCWRSSLEAGMLPGRDLPVRRRCAPAADRGSLARRRFRAARPVRPAAPGAGHHRSMRSRRSSTRPSCSTTSRTSRRWRSPTRQSR